MEYNWKKKRKTSKFVGAGSNRNEKGWDQQHGKDRQKRIEKENKTSGTERCENIETLYVNKK